MNITWGDELLDISGGLDILGVRATDQAVELALVNGITTVSQRARYLSTLTWALGEFLVNHQSEGFVWDRLMHFLRKVEFIVLAATRLDQQINGADATGSLGPNRNANHLRRLLSGQPVDFPEHGGAILGTYLGPCRAIGLLVDGDEAVPYRLTPRGKEIWEIKRKRLEDSPLITAISDGSEVSLDLVRKAIPEFSLGSLSTSADEIQCLHHALVTPWQLGNELDQTHVDDAYDGVTGTIRWIKDLLATQPNHAAGILAQNYERCTNGSSTDQIRRPLGRIRVPPPLPFFPGTAAGGTDAKPSAIGSSLNFSDRCRLVRYAEIVTIHARDLARFLRSLGVYRNSRLGLNSRRSIRCHQHSH